jgi:hypothetical protein
MHILLKDLLLESAVTDNPNFKKWFGNSKVVDAQGNPLPVVHSTHYDFNSFKHGDIGFHFGTPTAANSRSMYHARHFNADGERSMPVFLSIKNPIRLKDAGDWDKPQKTGIVIRNAVKVGTIDESELRKAIEIVRSRGIEPESNLYGGGIKSIFYQSVLKELGYDGVVYKNEVEGNDDSWIAFDATQIKSIHNVGDFSSNNPNIMKEDEEAESSYRKSWLERHNAQYTSDGRLIAYHGTPSKNLSSIKKNGFKYKTYFSLRPEYSKQIASTYHDTPPEKVTVLKVFLPLDAIDFIMSDIYSTRVIKFDETI